MRKHKTKYESVGGRKIDVIIDGHRLNFDSASEAVSTLLLASAGVFRHVESEYQAGKSSTRYGITPVKKKKGICQKK